MSNFGQSNTRSPGRFLVRITMILTGLMLLVGCSSKDKKESSEKKDENKRPAYERVAILRERFDQLELSLDEMERELEIQRTRIKKTRETALAVKRSLIKGNLKGYSIDTITTDPLVIAAIEKEKHKAEKDKDAEEQKEKSNSVLLDITLAILIILLVLFILFVALKDRKQASPYTMPFPRNPVGGAGDNDDEEEEDAALPPSPGSYGELNPAVEDLPKPPPPATDGDGNGEEPKP